MLAVRMMSKLALVSELFFLVIFIPRKNVEQYGSMSLSKHVSFCKIIIVYNSNLTASGTNSLPECQKEIPRLRD